MMARKLLLPFLLMLALGPSLFGQADRFMFLGGFQYEFIPIRGQFQTTELVTLPYYGLTFGVNYVAMHSNDQFALTVNPNIAVAYSGFQATNLMLQGPVFVMGKFGAGATPYNEQKFGIAAGVGGTYTYIYSELFDPRLNQGFLNPNAVVELTLNSRGSIYTLHGHWALSKARKEWAADTFEFSNFGVALKYSF